MRGKPFAVWVAQVVAVVFVLRCGYRVASWLVFGHDVELYGLLLGPAWIDLILGALAATCLWLSRSRHPTGLIAVAIPMALWLVLALFSPESWRMWHWAAMGFPSGLDGLLLAAVEPPVDHAYRSVMEMRGSVLGVFIEQVVFSIALGSLLFRTAARAYYREVGADASAPGPDAPVD